MNLPLVILTLWGVALILGVTGVFIRKKILIFLGMAAAMAGVFATFYLKFLVSKL